MSPRAVDCHDGGGGDPEYRVEPAVLVLSDDLAVARDVAVAAEGL